MGVIMDAKILDKIIKLKRQSESEFFLGNEGTSELFREKMEELMKKYSITFSMLEAEEKSEVKIEIINELGITSIVNPFLRINARTNLRQAWFEKLAEIIAVQYNCRVCPTNSGELRWFGYDYDREVAIFMFLRIAAIEKDKCDYWRNEERKNVGKRPLKNLFSKEVIYYPSEWMGDDTFNDGFHFGFRISLNENYKSHEKSEEFLRKSEEVQNFYTKENQTHYSYFNYDNSLEYLEERNYNPIAVKLGKKAGIAVSKQASKNPSAITITNPKLQTFEEDKVILLFDKSGSMTYSKMQFAKEGAINFCQGIKEKDSSVGLIAFGSDIETIFPPTKNFGKNEERKIGEIYPSGYTNLAGAIRAAVAYFPSRRSKRTICIITDGMPCMPFSDIDAEVDSIAAANEAKRQGIKIIAIGTDDAKQEFLDKLCSEEGLGILTDGRNIPLMLKAMAERI